MSYEQKRVKMVTRQIEARGIDDAAILSAMREVPRECFVSSPYRSAAYDDTPLPTSSGQTISQPYIVAFMLQALELTPVDRVLEIGTGSGYSAAILSHIVRTVFTVERHKKLVNFAQRRLSELEYNNVYLHHGDGTLGWQEHAPYNAIVVAAAGPRVPSALKAQLAFDGRLIMPVGKRHGHQALIQIIKTRSGAYREKRLELVRFVPLIGAEGYDQDK